MKKKKDIKHEDVKITEVDDINKTGDPKFKMLWKALISVQKAGPVDRSLDYLERNHKNYINLVVEEEIVGVIGFRVLSEVESAVEIVHLTVADSYKNQGHEMSLVESIIKRIRRRGYKTIVTLLGGDWTKIY